MTLRKAAQTAVKEIAIVTVAATIVVGLNIGIRSAVSAAKATRASELQKSIAGLSPVSVGRVVTVPGAQFRDSPITLFLVTSPECPHCAASQPFHRSLAQEVQNANVPLHVAIPKLTSAHSYLRSAGLSGLKVRNWADLGFRVTGIPAIIAVDRNGVVRRMWIGRLSPLQETELLGLVREPSRLTEAVAGNAASTEKRDVWRQTKDTILVDTRERRDFIDHHEPNSMNLPLSELPARAAFELDRSKRYLVDCSKLDAAECNVAVRAFEHEGYRTASWGGGVTSRSCAVTSVSESN